jgi:hypothetical protein
MRIAATTDGDVERRAWLSRISHRRTEAYALNELLGFNRILYAQLLFAPPHAITIFFYLFGQRVDHHAWHKFINLEKCLSEASARGSTATLEQAQNPFRLCQEAVTARDQID